MGVLLKFKEEKELKIAPSEWNINGVMQTISEMYGFAGKLQKEYYEIFVSNPSKGIDELPKYIAKARDINPPLVEAFAGGPNHDWTGPMLGIAGMFYPTLKGDEKKALLTNCIYFLDGLRYDYSQNHIELIEEPWLVRDIIRNRGRYWPGYRTEVNFLEKNRTWPDFQNNSHELRNDFFITFAIIKPKYSSLQVRQHFYKAFPDMVNRTLDAAAAFIDNETEQDVTEGKNREEALTENIKSYDPLLHEKILAKIDLKEWIDIPRHY